MALPKIKFCWNGSRVEASWHLGLFGFYTRNTSGRSEGLVISGRGLLAWLGGMLVVAYFAGAAAYLVWLDRRPYNFVGYADLVLPTRWSEIQKLRGRALVAEGLEDIEAKRWGPGLAKLRGGIARNPEEIQGRLVLADMFLMMKARKQAIETYDGGLAIRYPGRTYVEKMIKSATLSENFDWWIRTCDRALALIGNNQAYASDRRWLIQQKLSALIAADRGQEALKLAEVEGETGSSSIKEFTVLALINVGQADQAVDFLQSWQASREGGVADSQILRLQVRAFREANRIEDMERTLETLRQLSPTDPRSYVYGIVQRLLAKRRTDADVSLDQFLLRFGSRADRLLMLAAPLAEIGEKPMLERLNGYAAEQGFDLEPFRRFLVQSLVKNGDWQEAADVLAKIQAAPQKSQKAEVWYDLLGAQIQAALDAGDGAQSNLVNQVRGRQLMLTIYKDMVENMRRAGRPETARALITFAQGVYPQNAVLETTRRELDVEIAEKKAAAQAVKLAPAVVRSNTNAVTPALVARVATVVAEKPFFSRLEQLTKANDVSGALQLISETRLAKPVWLAARDVDLMREEIRLNGLAGDSVSLRFVARQYINGDKLRSAQILAIARDLHAAGNKESAVFLLRELTTKVPDYQPAVRLLNEWVPPAPATPVAQP